MRSTSETAIAGLGAAVLLVIFWSAAAWAPLHDWNSARFYPSYLLAAGAPLYPPAGAGIVNGWIYGPILPLLLIPATWIPSPTWALMVAAWINVLVLFAPIILILDTAIGASLPPRRRLLFALAATAALILLPTTIVRLAFLTCDQPAIGLGLLSCLVLHRWTPASGGWAPVGAALLAGTAAWSKQTEALLPVGQFLYLWIRRSRSVAGRYAVCVIATQAVLLLTMVACFGWSPLWLNLAWIPAHHPLAGGAQGLGGRLGWMLACTTPFIAVSLWRLRPWRRDPPAADKPAALAEQLLIAGTVLLPAGFLAAAKIGGDENSFHFVYYFALAALLAAANWVRDSLCAHPVRLAATLAGLAAAATWHVQPLTPIRFAPAPQLQQAIALARTAPGRILFPKNPLVTWHSERSQYHLEWGVFDRSLAGLPISRANFWQGMPVHLQYVTYPTPAPYLFMQLLPALQLVRQLPGLALYVVEPGPAEDENRKSPPERQPLATPAP